MSNLIAQGHRLAQWARSVPPAVVDVLIAVACYVVTALYAVLYGHELWVILLAAGNAAPLLWRRRYPFAVTWVVAVGSMWLVLVGASADFIPAQLVATYTFAALCPPVKRFIAATATALGITAAVVIPNDELLNLGTNAVVYAVAFALGTSARARHDRIAMLEERARRLAEGQDAAAARERERIAREMHDILAHSMSLVIIQAEAGPVAVRSDPDKAEKVFANISTAARDAMAQLRRVLGVLASAEPSRQPLPDLDALSTLIATARQTGLDVAFEERGPRPTVSADVATTVYRIVQESLTNTFKHARASSIWVRLDWSDEALELSVRDDGRDAGGYDGRLQPGMTDGIHGRGLIGMRERAASVGGRLTAGPVANADGTVAEAGFQVWAYLPLAADG